MSIRSMRNSTIQDKYTECYDCVAEGDNSLKATIAGRCKNYHYSIYRKKLMVEKQKAKSKFKSLEHTEANRYMLIKSGKIVDVNLELWYLARKYEMKGKCEECGAWTNRTHDKYYRWSCCHVVPKALVPSVALHPSNFIELCKIHHQEFDAGFERAKRMKCFPLAKRLFDTFKHLIPETKMKWVNPYLLEADTPDPTGSSEHIQKQNKQY